MLDAHLLTADEAAKLLRISRRIFDGHVARGDIAHIAIGLGLMRARKRFATDDIARFRERQRRVECLPEPTRVGRRTAGLPQHGTIDFEALLEERRAVRRMARYATHDGGH